MLIICAIKCKNVLDIYKWGCGPFSVSLLTDRHLKELSQDGFCLHFPIMGAFTSAPDVWHVMSHAEISHLGHHILHYISKFRLFERDN